MRIGDAIFAVLSADAAVSALVGTRIYPLVAPQGAVPPLIVYQVISDVPENVIEGLVSDRLVNSRIQLDCYAKTFPQAQSVAEAVDAVLSALSSASLSGWREVSRTLYDDEAQLHRVSMDFSFWK